MPYKFLNASMPIQVSAKDRLTRDFQNALNKGFAQSTDYFEIKKEEPYGSGNYIDAVARIDRVFDAKKLMSVGDDYKRLLFKTPDESPRFGSMYYFDENYWIVQNLEAIKSLGTSCIIRRCNNFLKWKDITTGRVFSLPCNIDYLVKETRDYTTGGSTLVQPSGFLDVVVQFNEETNKIRPSQRFLFGNKNNWNAYKVMGGGVQNFDNRQTINNMSVGMLRLSMLANQVNTDTDDLENGIADYSDYVFTLGLNVNNVSVSVGSEYNLIASVKENGVSIDRELIWTSSDVSKITVNEYGIITPISPGSASVTCKLKDNPSVFDVCLVNIVQNIVDNVAIVVSPNVDYIYEGDEQVFYTTLYINNIEQPNTFTYTINQNGVPSENFFYNILSGKSFWIKNVKKYMDKDIIITASSGDVSINIPIKLKGKW